MSKLKSIKRRIDFLAELSKYIRTDGSRSSVFGTNDDESSCISFTEESILSTNSENDLNAGKKHHSRELSYEDVCFLFLSLFHRHRINKEAQNHIIKFCNILWRNKVTIPRSGFLMEKQMNKCKLIGVTKKLFCFRCKAFQEIFLCECNPKNRIHVFIFNLKETLEYEIKKNYYDIMKNQNGNDLKNLSLITNGRIYQNTKHLNGHNKISLIMSFDDSSILKSAHYYVSPISGTIAELSNSNRHKRENIFMSALWVGKKKPNMESLKLFWKVGFVDEFKQFENEPLIVSRDENEESFSVRTLCIVCDKLAKNLLLYHVQFNGYYGCVNCNIPGEYIENKVVFPFSNEEYELKDLESPFESEGCTPGRKGDSILRELHIKLPESVPIGKCCDIWSH